MIKTFDQFINEKFADKYSKQKWENIAQERDEYFDEIVDLINNAYKDVAGGTLESPATIIKDKEVDYWQAIDVDDDPDCDAVIFGKNTKFGIKVIGIGQDGGRDARMEVIRKQLTELKKPGNYCEVSTSLGKFLDGIQYINTKEEVEKVINKKIEWVGAIDGYSQDGWYYRDIHGRKTLKILIGRPNGIEASSKEVSD
jgi:hypothetical protein